MNDQELRALVRHAVQRHLGGAAAVVPSPESRVPGLSRVTRAEPVPGQSQGHASHAIYVTLVNTGEACVIEPSVPCNHCNYCKSHGH